MKPATKIFITLLISLLVITGCQVKWQWPIKIEKATNKVKVSPGEAAILDTAIVNTAEENQSEKPAEEQLPDIAAQATLKTNFGEIIIKFYPDEAPLTVTNFTKLAQQNFYNGTRFHRVIKGFMIQGGDPLSKDDDKTKWGTGGPGYTFADEINQYKLVKGKVAMANAGPNTNGSQFFIVTAESAPWLDGKHTVFGEVTAGMEVAVKIENLKTDSQDHPLEEVKIETIQLVYPEAKKPAATESQTAAPPMDQSTNSTEN